MAGRASLVLFALALAGCGGTVKSEETAAAPDASVPEAGTGVQCTVRAGAQVTPELAWDMTDPIGMTLSSIAFRDDGDLLAGRWKYGEGPEVYRISGGGVLHKVDWTPEHPDYDAHISPRGDGFLQAGTIHGASGEVLGHLPAYAADAGMYGLLFAKYSASGQRILAEWGVIDLESSHPDRLELLDLQGSPVASFSMFPEGATVPRSDDALLGSTQQGMTRWRLDGTVEWSVPEKGFVELRASGDGQRVMTERAKTIEHIKQGVVVGSFEAPDAIWDTAMDEAGVYSAASMSDPGLIMMFENGQWVRTVETGLKYVTTLAINALGEVALGGHDDAKLSHVMMIQPDGQVAFDCVGGHDEGAFSPYVRLEPSGSALLVHWPDRLRFDRLER